jgi:hypothetical protein
MADKFRSQAMLSEWEEDQKRPPSDMNTMSQIDLPSQERGEKFGIIIACYGNPLKMGNIA